MILRSELFDVFDRCELRYAYERRWEPTFIGPTALLYASLEAALVADDPEQAAKDAAVAVARDKRIENGDLNPVSTVRHVGMLAGIIGLALHQRFGKMTRIRPVQFGARSHVWEPNVFSSSEGLHRVAISSDGDDASIRPLAHQWGTLGEITALEKPVTLTVVVVGAQRGGRRHSPWTKGLIHPVSKGLRFKKKGEGNFKSSWQDVWREQSQFTAQAWLKKMQEDEVLDDLIVTRVIPYTGTDARLRRARRDMTTLVQLMSEASEESPMRRSSCDLFGGCPFARSCWSATGERPGDLPDLYRPRAEQEEHTPVESGAHHRRPVPVFRTQRGPLAG